MLPMILLVEEMAQWERYGGGGVGAVGENLKEGRQGGRETSSGVARGAVGDSTGTDTSSSSLRVRSMTTASSFLGCESFLSTEHWVVALDADSWKEKTQLSKHRLLIRMLTLLGLTAEKRTGV